MLRSTKYTISSDGARIWDPLLAASSLPLCPVGLLEVLRLQPNGRLVVDTNGWTPLHHVASAAQLERDILVATGDYLHEPDDDENLPCLARLQWLLQHDRAAAQIADHHGRLPLHIAVVHNLPVRGLKLLYEVYPDALLRQDRAESLFPVLLAAKGPDARLNTIYHLLLTNPQIVGMSHKPF